MNLKSLFKSKRVRELETRVTNLKRCVDKLEETVMGKDEAIMTTRNLLERTKEARDAAVRVKLGAQEDNKKLEKERDQLQEQLEKAKDAWNNSRKLNDSLKARLAETERLWRERGDEFTELTKRIEELKGQRRTWQTRAEAAEYALAKIGTVLQDAREQRTVAKPETEEVPA